ncbi:MAG TPA: hypothetical protein VGJ78_26320 [Vicinamibacterales bacterium]|jgi:hypothetical protein
MTADERLRAVRLMGFTERQAGFLVTVMLYAGVCLGRHYCTFARIAYGRKMHDFFESLLSRGYVTARRCGHNRARLFHVHYKPLYRAIGETNNRHRRPMALARAVERLMVLDAVLADRDRTWLGTEEEKLRHFILTHRIPRRDLPALTFRAEDAETTRYFPDKLPIGVDGERGGYVFVYLVTRDLPIDFRAFLERHAELLRALPDWTLRLLVPRHKTDAIPAYQAAFGEQLATPLDPAVLDDLRWYFRARRNRPDGCDERFDQAARAFGAPRFQAMYRAWLQRGEPVLDATLSPVLADALAWSTGRLETHVLPHSYLRLLSLVNTA